MPEYSMKFFASSFYILSLIKHIYAKYNIKSQNRKKIHYLKGSLNLKKCSLLNNVPMAIP